MPPLDIEAELARGEHLLEQGRYAEAIACARAILAYQLGDERALDVIDRAEQRAGSGALASDDDWTVGEVIDDRWTVFGSARGGMGRVYFVRDRVWDDAELAVKSFLGRPGMTGDADHKVRALFRREAQVWLDLGAHPHIVSGYYTLEVRGRLRFFMEFVAGQTLLAVARGEPLPLPRALDLAIQLASGVAYVHECGVVHRDLKPTNCIVMADDTLRITDFGLGKRFNQHEPARGHGRVTSANLSAHGAGTPFYMAPEQWGSLAAAERPADVYAVGVILWELLVGRRPFETSSTCWSAYESLPPAIERLVASGAPPSELLLRLMHAELPPLSPRRLGLVLPGEVDDLILSCLSKDPGKRPSATALRARLIHAHQATARHARPRPTPVAIAPSAAGESNRALSYEVMGERDRAISILDSALARDGAEPYLWVNRAAIAIEEGTPPCVYGARAVSELLPAHPGLPNDRAMRPVLERLARYYQRCPPVMALDTGTTVHVAGCQGQVMIFEAATGRLQATHNTCDVVLGVACLGDTHVAAADGSSIALFPLAAAGQLPVRLHGHGDLVTGLAASNEGHQLASTSNDGMLTIWDVKAGLVTRQTILPALPRSVTWHPSGAAIVTTTTGQLYEIDAANRVTRIAVTSASCTAIGPGGALVVGGLDGTLTHVGLDGKLTRVGSLAAIIEAHAAAVTAVHAAGGVLASAGEDGKIRVWGTDGLMAEAPPIHGRIRGLRIVSNGAEVLIGSEAGALHVWSLRATGTWPRAIQRDFPVLEKQRRAEEVAAIVTRLSAGDPDALDDADRVRARYLQHRRDPSLLASRHHLIRTGGLAGGSSDTYSVWTTPIPGRATGIAISPDGSVAVGVADRVAILEGHTGTARLHLRHPARSGVSYAGNSVVAADDSDHVVCMDLDGRVRWVDQWRGTGQMHAIACAAGVVVAGGWVRSIWLPALQAQGAVRLWRMSDWTEISLKRVGHTVTSVAISADASVVAAGLDDGRSRVWAVDHRSLVCEVSGSGEVTAIALSPDVRHVAVGYATGAIELSLLAEPAAPVSATPLRAAVTSLSFSADGRWLCGAARDGSVVVVQLPLLRRVLEIHAHSQAAHAVISPDGDTITTASEDGTAKRWQIIAGWSPPDQIIDELAERVAMWRSWRALCDPMLDVVLEVWRVLSRVRSLPGLSDAVRERAENLASTIASALRAIVQPQLAMSTEARIRNPYSRVLAVDSALAALWPERT